MNPMTVITLLCAAEVVRPDCKWLFGVADSAGRAGSGAVDTTDRCQPPRFTSGPEKSEKERDLIRGTSGGLCGACEL